MSNSRAAGEGGEMIRHVTADPALLRSALSRISSAGEWAKYAKLFNIAGDLQRASKEIRDFLNVYPLKPPTDNKG